MQQTVQKGMEQIITSLTSGITQATLFDVVSKLMPFVIVMVIASFGFFELRKLISGASKGKARL